MVDERRVEARFQVSAPIIVEVGSDHIRCRLGNVSDNGAGAYVRGTKVRVSPGEQVLLTVPDRDVSATAGVRRVDREDSGFGVEFDDRTVGAIIAGWAQGAVL